LRVGEFGVSGDDWVMEWRDEVFPEKLIPESWKVSFQELTLCDSTMRAAAALSTGFVTSDTTIPPNEFGWYEELSAFLPYQWEANVGHLRASLVLALSGSYNAAFTLLRNSLELLVKGAFYDSLAHPRFRDNWKLAEEYAESKFRRYVMRMAKQEPGLDDLDRASAKILGLIEPWLNDNYREFFKFPNMALALIRWGLLDPLDRLEAVRLVNRMYSELSSSVHEYPSKTDFGRAFNELRTFEYEPKVLQKSLNSFLREWRRVLDLGTVLAINLETRVIDREPDATVEITQKLMGHPEYEKSDLPLTKRLLEYLTSQDAATRWAST
jgi:hypothetical protein